MIRFIGVEINGGAQVPNVLSAFMLLSKSILRQAQKRGQDPEILHRQFSPCQSLIQFNLCPHSASLISVPGCAPARCCVAAASLLLEPALGVRVAAGPVPPLQGENHEQMGKHVLQLQQPLLNLVCIVSVFQTERSLSQFFMGFAGPSS